MILHLHTIPVDPSLTVAEAWHELCLMGVRATDTGEPTWATIRCDGTECEGIADGRVTCRCVWADKRCTHPATQEDGLCDWCGVRRPEDLTANPNAIFGPITGEFLGLGGRGYDHIDSSRIPDACWMSNSGRTLA